MNPLYGVVATYEGDSVMGYIQWDHDERLSTDVLDGKTTAETLKVPMGKIKRITPMRGRSRVSYEFWKTICFIWHQRCK